MKITNVETFIANAVHHNFVFLKLTTDTGLTGVGEATLEWQDKTVETLLHEWAIDRVIGRDPFDIEAVIGGMIRDQYQGGSTVLTAISGIEIAMWDIIGKSCQQPVYRLLGGRCHERIPAYANAWFGGAVTPQEHAECAKNTVQKGFSGLKFDPLGTAWKNLDFAEKERAEEMVAVVREAIGPEIKLMIEFHGRLAVDCAVEMVNRFEKYNPSWCEEPVAPESIELLTEVKRRTNVPIAAGERLYMLADFFRLISTRSIDVVQMDIAHCGGLLVSKKIAAMAAVQDMRVSPHCSIGPVALAACLHFDLSTPNFFIQEDFSEYGVEWRHDFVHGWDPLKDGEFVLTDTPGLGLELNEDAIADHPYRKDPFPSLWDETWWDDFDVDQYEG
jgi:galactonate dehydratase